MKDNVIKFSRKSLPPDIEYVCPRCAEIKARENHMAKIMSSEEDVGTADLIHYAVNAEMVMHLKQMHPCTCFK